MLAAEPAHGAHGDQAIELQKHKSPGPDTHGPGGGIGGLSAAPMYSTVDVDESGYESDKTDATAFSDSYLVPFEQDDPEGEEEEDEPDTAGKDKTSDHTMSHMLHPGAVWVRARPSVDCCKRRG